MSILPEGHLALIEKLFDAPLSDQEIRELNAVLRRSPDARAYYWHLVMLEGYLADLPGWIAGQQYATQLAFSETLEAFIEMESNAEATLQTYPEVTEPIVEKQQITWQDVRMVGGFCLRSIAQQRATWGVLAAALVCIVALVYATWFTGGSAEPTSSPMVDLGQNEPTQSPLPAEPTRVAVVLNHRIDDQNASANKIASGAEFTQGDAIELGSGDAMQLEYETGVRVILRGPGAFELRSDARLGIDHGQVTAAVPPAGKGFTISTAQTDFIDHGTEFGITLDKSGRGEVVVLNGLIEARPATEAMPQIDSAVPGMMLREGIAAKLAPDSAIPEAEQAIDQEQLNRFARHWEDVIYRPVVTGEITYVTTPLASLELGQAVSTQPLLIPERRGVVLASDLHLNADKGNREIIEKIDLNLALDQDYVLQAGTKIDAFLIHFDIGDPAGQGVVECDFALRFPGRIVGIAERQKYQIKTDGLFGIDSMQYPTQGNLRGAADPPGHPNYDWIRVSDDRRTLRVKMRLSGLDQIRVLVESTDP